MKFSSVALFAVLGAVAVIAEPQPTPAPAPRAVEERQGGPTV